MITIVIFFGIFIFITQADCFIFRIAEPVQVITIFKLGRHLHVGIGIGDQGAARDAWLRETSLLLLRNFLMLLPGDRLGHMEGRRDVILDEWWIDVTNRLAFILAAVQAALILAAVQAALILAAVQAAPVIAVVQAAPIIAAMQA